MKKTIYCFALLLLALPLMAQKKRNLYFLKENGRQVRIKDSADFIRIIEEPDSGETNFVLREFYLNEQKKAVGKVSAFEPTLKYEGNLITYRRNGTMESIINYQNGTKIGPAFYFFENRKVKKELLYLPLGSATSASVNFENIPNFKLVYQTDSLDNVQVKDGNGYLKETTFKDGDEFIEEGKYKNGFKDSLWVGRYASGKSRTKKCTKWESWFGAKILLAMPPTIIRVTKVHHNLRVV